MRTVMEVLTGMRPILDLLFPKRLYGTLQLIAQRACAWGRSPKWVMLLSLTVALIPWQSVAQPIHSPLAPPEQAQESLRRGRVTMFSNLRASPSMHSEIVGVAKEGSQVKILLESGRWYHVRSEEGVEAWIYKPLVLIEQEPINGPNGSPAALVPLDSADTGVAADVVTPDVSVELRAENPTEEPGVDVVVAESINEPHVLPHREWRAWFIGIWLSHFSGLAAYVIIALVMVLVLMIALQLRAARQLRLAMQEMGQILDLVEEIYAGATLALTSDRASTRGPMSTAALAQRPAQPEIEFSPTEYTVLGALSGQREIQESELGKILAAKGFVGVLIKAVIGDIVRKTGKMGLPWVEVRYAQGRYHYRLRPEAVPDLGEQRWERR
jgi:Bacterial SH3 domain